MSELADMLTASAIRLAKAHSGSNDLAGLLSAMQENGLLQPVSQSEGEIGWGDAAGMLAALGATYPVAAPADAIAADFVASSAHLDVAGAATLASGVLELDRDGKVSGAAVSSVGPDGDGLLVVSAASQSGERRLIVLLVAGAEAKELRNLSGERRTEYSFQSARPISSSSCGETDDPCLVAGAFARCLLQSGAISATLSLTVEHCQTRKQFGRPLISLQAVQQQLATLAAENAAAAAICRLAARRQKDASWPLLVGAAKVRVARASEIAIDVAHQCHGAIGFTEEYSLQRFTRAMMAWRLEFGGTRFWSRRIGGKFGDRNGGQSFWELAVNASGERDVA